MAIDLSLARDRIREVAEGRYGELVVSDDDQARALTCNLLCHGSVYLEPGALVDGTTYSPGAVPDAAYHLGWIVAALADPCGHVLMAGLGAGVGVCLLLDQFPHLRVTVVEIDPLVVRLARTHFPLLAAFERSGRATILTTDIAEVVKGGGRWSAALIDTYQEDMVVHCPADLLSGLRHQADAVWVNVIDDGLTRVDRCATALVAAGWHVRTAMPIIAAQQGLEYPTGNHLLGTEIPSSTAVTAFVPFAGLVHPHAEQARQSYAATVRRMTCMPPRGINLREVPDGLSFLEPSTLSRTRP